MIHKKNWRSFSDTSRWKLTRDDWTVSRNTARDPSTGSARTRRRTPSPPSSTSCWTPTSGLLTLYCALSLAGDCLLQNINILTDSHSRYGATFLSLKWQNKRERSGECRKVVKVPPFLFAGVIKIAADSWVKLSLEQSIYMTSKKKNNLTHSSDPVPKLSDCFL